MVFRRVFFSNVPFTTSEQTLRDLFSQCGTVLGFLPFMKPRSNEFKGMGIVVFETTEMAQFAVARLRDVDVDGRPIWVAEDTSERGKAFEVSLDGGGLASGGFASGGFTASGFASGGFGAGGPAGPPAGPALQEQLGTAPFEALPSVTTARVFFSNVPFTTSEATLRAIFEGVGPVAKLSLFQGSKGFRGMGVCTYETPKAAAEAIALLRDVDVDGRPLWVAEDTGRAEASHGGPGPAAGSFPPQAARQAPQAYSQVQPMLPFMQPSQPMLRHASPPRSGGGGGGGGGGGRAAAVGEPTEVFFSNVPYTTTEDTLMQVFSKAGPVANLRLFTKQTGESRGMGVCTFVSPDSALWAVHNLRDTVVDGRPLWVSTHAGGGDGPGGGRPASVPMSGSNVVFFSNVPYDVTEGTLVSLFEEVGRVMELHLFRKKDGSSRGMGHCTFQAPSMAAAAVRALRDRNVGGRPIWVAEDTNQGQGMPPMMAPTGFGGREGSYAPPPLAGFRPGPYMPQQGGPVRGYRQVDRPQPYFHGGPQGRRF